MPYLLGLFHWGACRVSKLGVKSKRKSCKLDQFVWEMHAMPSFGLYARVPTAHSLRRNPPKLRRTEWAVGTHACIQSQKESVKLHIACISHIQTDQFCNFYFGILPSIYSPCTRPSETILTNKASIERQINRLSRDIKLDE